MTETTETFNSDTITTLNRRVAKVNNLYVVQIFMFNESVGSLVYSSGKWVDVSKKYAHSTSAFAALGRLYQKANKFNNL